MTVREDAGFRKLAGWMLSRVTSVVDPVLIDGSVAAETLDAGAAIDFQIAGVVGTNSPITLDEAIISSWDATNEPIRTVPDGYKCMVMFLFILGSTTTTVKCRQGPIVLSAATAVHAPVPDGHAYIGGLEIDDPASGLTLAVDDIDDASCTWVPGFWPPSGPSAFDVETETYP